MIRKVKLKKISTKNILTNNGRLFWETLYYCTKQFCLMSTFILWWVLCIESNKQYLYLCCCLCMLMLLCLCRRIVFYLATSTLSVLLEIITAKGEDWSKNCRRESKGGLRKWGSEGETIDIEMLQHFRRSSVTIIFGIVKHVFKIIFQITKTRIGLIVRISFFLGLPVYVFL